MLVWRVCLVFLQCTRYGQRLHYSTMHLLEFDIKIAYDVYQPLHTHGSFTSRHCRLLLLTSLACLRSVWTLKEQAPLRSLFVLEPGAWTCIYIGMVCSLPSSGFIMDLFSECIQYFLKFGRDLHSGSTVAFPEMQSTHFGLSAFSDSALALKLGTGP